MTSATVLLNSLPISHVTSVPYTPSTQTQTPQVHVSGPSVNIGSGSTVNLDAKQVTMAGNAAVGGTMTSNRVVTDFIDPKDSSKDTVTVTGQLAVDGPLVLGSASKLESLGHERGLVWSEREGISVFPQDASRWEFKGGGIAISGPDHDA